jgi:cytochrome c6
MRSLIFKILSLSMVVFFACLGAGAIAAETQGAPQLFEAQCAGCHAGGGNIIRRGKNLKLKALVKNHVDTEETIVALITKGKGNMSAYADRLTPEEISTLAVYVLDQAQLDWKVQ